MLTVTLFLIIVLVRSKRWAWWIKPLQKLSSLCTK